VLCEYVLHVFCEDTENDINNEKRKSKNYFLVSTRVFKSIGCCLLKGSVLVRFFIKKN
jgi:hypothetical protein